MIFNNLLPWGLNWSWGDVTVSRLTSFLPDPDVPSSRLAPDDREPCDSRRPLLPEKSEKKNSYPEHEKKTELHLCQQISMELLKKYFNI